jgi:hypothetical protein
MPTSAAKRPHTTTQEQNARIEQSNPMECHFDVVIQGDADAIEKVCHLLNISITPAQPKAEVNKEFLSACLKYGEKQGKAAGKALLTALASFQDGWRLQMTGCNEHQTSFKAQYGSCGEDVANEIALFLSRYPLGLVARIEGDYDEDPDGFRYTVRDGQVSREQGIYSPDYEQNHALQLLSEDEILRLIRLKEAQEDEQKSAEFHLAVQYCEKRGIAITPGFRKRSKIARYAIVRIDATPPKLVAVTCESLAEINEFILTNFSSVADCQALILDMKDRVVLKPVYDEQKLQEMLAASKAPVALPLRVSQYLEVSSLHLMSRLSLGQLGSAERSYLSLAPVGPMD